MFYEVFRGLATRGERRAAAAAAGPGTIPLVKLKQAICQVCQLELRQAAVAELALVSSS